MNISVNNNLKYTNISNSSKNNSRAQVKQNISFTGVSTGSANIKSKYFESVKKFLAPVIKPINNLYDKFTTKVAEVEASTLASKWLKSAIQYSEKYKIDVVKHISSINGVIIAGLYIYKTMKNDKLDPDKKVTLSINQGIVAAVATTAGYLADGAIGKQVDKFSRKFMAVNYRENREVLGKLKGGLRAAASMMVFGTMYRYIAPVLVTPIANKIGNNIHDKKIAKEKAAKGIVAQDESKPVVNQADSSKVVTSAVAFSNAPALGSNRPILQKLMAQKFS